MEAQKKKKKKKKKKKAWLPFTKTFPGIEKVRYREKKSK